METSKNPSDLPKKPANVKKNRRRFQKSQKKSISPSSGSELPNFKTTISQNNEEVKTSLKEDSSKFHPSASAPIFVPTSSVQLNVSKNNGHKASDIVDAVSSKDEELRKHAKGEGKRSKNRKRSSKHSEKQAVDLKSSNSSQETSSSKGSVNNKSERSREAKSRMPKNSKEIKKGLDLSKLDMTSRMIVELKNRLYECSVCTDTINPSTSIWSCGTCYHVFHLSCIRKWCKNSIEQRNEDAWRCPYCQSNQTETSLHYLCWCGKQEKPEFVKNLVPHSCGDPCGKTRGQDCEHPCPLLCHPGPCPPCTATVEKFCLCGKESIHARCSNISKVNTEPFRCENVCDELLPCGEHTCKKRCHSGLCGACFEPINAKCYCGLHSKTYPCSSLPSPSISKKDENGSVKEWFGYYSCNNPCTLFFDCGLHKCSKTCHPISETRAHCPFATDVLTKCPCGKEDISFLLKGHERKSCSDPIPTCENICGKLLSCGHRCKYKCHLGSCGTCSETLTIPCRCTANEVQVTCEQLQNGFIPTCERLCTILLSCGRHQCNKKCCSGYSKAQTRLARRPKGAKLRYHLLTEEFEEEHICFRPCNKKLSCGNHFCQHMCHRGPCPRCLEASFEELPCTCGRTRLYPPVACGTPIPDCPYLCVLPKSCHHPQVKHNCHPTSEPCPPCPYFVKKRCLCGKHILENQPCYRENVRCGELCNKLLSCKTHFCEKLCHPDGECESSCKKECGKRRMYCEHVCQSPCHAGHPCDERIPCKAPLEVSCECGRIRKKVTCDASYDNPDPQHKVSCTLECSQQQRNKLFAEALNIKTDRRSNDVAQYTKSLLVFYGKHSDFADEVESLLRNFVNNKASSFRFPSMRREQRAFVHMFAKLLGLESVSFDPEPKRNVMVYNKGEAKLPNMLLKEANLYHLQHPEIPLKPDSLLGPEEENATASHIDGSSNASDSGYNAFVLKELLKEVNDESAIFSVLDDIVDFNHLTWSILFGENYIILKPLNTDLIVNKTGKLVALRPLVNRRLADAGIASRCEICEINDKNEIVKTRSQRIHSKKKAFLSLVPDKSIGVINRYKELATEL
ncbi:shuttle craft like transcriptional repressor/ubiquitin-protein ligase E3 [Schizosaccharomyces pombe]|uniref:FKBP12-associated protein 1 homolog n=1 Tax=Schizosaccharomyces pombe (strain 972 / ATCC 24843) TaxID=284812 RepID=FAP1H_SCHPO|nr:putative shuttle craft like transcriptional regulator [Schizosaccharomyces pombe]O74853.1 RecName: Full=FKBP12-associated protein 1 homolog [Schizosaccharomyces pombe 972h-]CAA21417.1 shuttle craft like transcriptional regulator (predicted) [Schizosaccharomyces pombe]|eukprot:NP_588382.1 putative shuttle craft like transcriptional regulator [Schizosaccharomyces pombe]